MKNENKCFFSISLENGITITGTNPYKVIEFLTSLESALYWAVDRYADYNLLCRQEETQKLLEDISNAALTISDHIGEKED